MRLGKLFQMADEHLEPKEDFFFFLHISIHKSKLLRLDQMRIRPLSNLLPLNMKKVKYLSRTTAFHAAVGPSCLIHMSGSSMVTRGVNVIENIIL